MLALENALDSPSTTVTDLPLPYSLLGDIRQPYPHLASPLEGEYGLYYIGGTVRLKLSPEGCPLLIE